MSGLRRRWVVAHFSLGVLASWTSGSAAAAAQEPVVLVVGDSLSAEYGLKAGDGWVALLQKRLAEQKKPYRVVNASISGDTTAGGRSRLPTALRTHKPAVVVIELGGNDALRGLPLASTRDNLMAMAKAAQEAGAKVVVVGMQVPPNYGAAYGREFEGLFADVAKQAKTGLVPFLLKGVADRADAMDWFQPDRIHPLAKAHPQMLDNVWPALKPLL
ncbi:arylesterase [Roseateles sp. BYS78W]|uniref:Arylesterase n=1 Tax=Pelomonas candidula TaxID=3299025 RepID=A0ABW7HB76_9BURK